MSILIAPIISTLNMSADVVSYAHVDKSDVQVAQCGGKVHVGQICGPVCDAIFSDPKDMQRAGRIVSDMWQGRCDAICTCICDSICDQIAGDPFGS